MGKAIAFCVVLAAAGVMGFGVLAQDEVKKDARPDVAAMTMEQLLEEFLHPPEGKLPHPPPQRRIDVINALRRLGEPLVTKLRADLKDGDAKAKIAAALVLNSLGNVARPAVPELVATLGDTDEQVRAWSVMALGNLKDPRAYRALVEAGRDPAPGVRSAVLRSAGPSLADGAFATAVLALSDPDRFVRRAAVTQTWILGNKRAAAFLIPLLDDVEIQSYQVIDGVKTADRNCDEAVRALELLVNGTSVSSAKGTQEEHDALVAKWKAWWKDKGAEFDAKLYAEPELKRPLK